MMNHVHYETFRDSSMPSYTVKYAYSPHRNGFVISRAAVEWMSANNHPNAIELLKYKPEQLPMYRGGDSECDPYSYPISIHNFCSYNSYFWNNRDDPLLIQAIEKLGKAACHPSTVIEIAELKILPGETYSKVFNTSMGYSYDDSEYIRVGSEAFVNVQ